MKYQDFTNEALALSRAYARKRFGSEAWVRLCRATLSDGVDLIPSDSIEGLRTLARDINTSGDNPTFVTWVRALADYLENARPHRTVCDRCAGTGKIRQREYADPRVGACNHKARIVEVPCDVCERKTNPVEAGR